MTVTRHDGIEAALRVSYVSAAWSLANGSMAVVAGLGAHSTALVGTGADVLADLLSTFMLLWRFRVERGGHEAPHLVERRAHVVAAVCLLVVAVVVGTTSALRLASDSGARPTVLAVTIAAVSVVVLPGLSWWKYRVAAALPSRALRTDGHIGIVGAATAALSLLGLAATSAFGWTQADPAAALVVAGLAGGTGVWNLLTR